MIKKGLVSITFRQFSPEKIINLAKSNGLSCIEWGSDVHVPVGNMEKAAEIAALMKKSQLESISYGTYYRLGTYENPVEEFMQYLETAKVLEAKNLRLWAGVKEADDYTAAEKIALVKEAKQLCKIAKEHGMTVSFEYHHGTLTGTTEGALELIENIDEDNAFLYWQPNQFKTNEYNMQGLEKVKNYVSNVHIFHWDASKRFTLEEGITVWKKYLRKLEGNRAVLMEFVKDDSEEQFVADAISFGKIVREENNKHGTYTI